MKLAPGNPVEKTRYKQKFGGFTWEIDVFEGENSGLVLAEVELENESDEVEVPEWAGKEVSHDNRFFNFYLSEHPYSTW